jgi:hypothetical protein
MSKCNFVIEHARVLPLVVIEHPPMISIPSRDAIRLLLPASFSSKHCPLKEGLRQHVYSAQVKLDYSPVDAPTKRLVNLHLP